MNIYMPSNYLHILDDDDEQYDQKRHLSFWAQSNFILKCDPECDSIFINLFPLL